jgi:hypothetical protein
MLYLFCSEQSGPYDCCELLHRVLVCCTLSQTYMNCQPVHVTAFLSTGIQVDSLSNCTYIYCIKICVLKIWGIGSLQFLCTFPHVCAGKLGNGYRVVPAVRHVTVAVCLCLCAGQLAQQWSKVSMLCGFRFQWTVVDSLSVVEPFYLY